MKTPQDRKVEYSPRSSGQAELIESLYHNDIVFALGPAGSGKTFIAAMKAIELFQEQKVGKIILTRPAVTADEDLGFLPGDMNEKLNPYLFPLIDAFTHHWQPGWLPRLQKMEQAEIASVGHMRGRSFYDSIIIVDEAQNLTYPQMKMILTRFGKGCKMIITGDPDQVDLEGRKESGLVAWADMLCNTKGVGVVRLTSKDIHRHALVKRIVEEEEKYKR